MGCGSSSFSHGETQGKDSGGRVPLIDKTTQEQKNYIRFTVGSSSVSKLQIGPIGVSSQRLRTRATGRPRMDRAIEETTFT